MVGIFFWRSSGHTRPHTSSLRDEKENEATERDQEDIVDLDYDLGKEENLVVEFDADFKPINHPLEPPDDDRPAKYPIPDSCLFNDKGIWKELENRQKRAELLTENKESIVESQYAQAVCKRHHTILNSQDNPILSTAWKAEEL